jgi:hypothetical protein
MPLSWKVTEMNVAKFYKKQKMEGDEVKRMGIKGGSPSPDILSVAL